ncbi:MAG: protein-glutamate O-methyltransferase [Alphaproteobacteria bacterium]|nr:protein-glutamate O-methyltransferase [Alphaproteobacteria bacterium]
MRPDQFTLLANLVKTQSGIVLTPDKTYLLESRLPPVARKHGLKGMEDLVNAVKAGRNKALADDVVDAMTTNESLFFRDQKPFQIIKDEIFPKLSKSRGGAKTIKIWSAACSSGQEPYSLAMMAREERSIQGWTFDILASDISREMLKKAQAGTYTQFEVQRGLPITMLVKYFKQNGDKWIIDKGLQSHIRFKEFNLLHDMAPLGTFDIVMCRNVLIYFDQPTKSKILAGIAKRLAPDGVLFLGGAETVLGLSKDFKPVPSLRGVYQLA